MATSVLSGGRALPSGVTRADIYKLATELKVHLDALLRLTEAVELLEFATLAQGDITLTPLGETFAEASILARKEIFATRIRRLPMFKWLLAMLRVADKHRLEKDVINTALKLDFTPAEATHQVKVAINWGRYAELLAYADISETLYIETGSTPPGMTCYYALLDSLRSENMKYETCRIGERPVVFSKFSF
jgi:NitT/TauT family transport system ATP-binding protein